nr:hypothetical protein [Clostridium chromiireducens]
MYKSEDYSFAEYLYDKKIIKSLVEVTPADLMERWLAEGANYVKYCRDNNYYFEKLADY